MKEPAATSLKFGAIDIGSNAVRMLFCRVFEDGGEPVFKKDALFRVPLRLGEDAFCREWISPENAAALVSILSGFRHLLDAYRPAGVMACGTAALREADNAGSILAEVEAASGLRIDIISPQREAELVFANHVERLLDPEKPYLYIDVGGGSTELTYFRPNRDAVSRSFPIGTIRLLKGLVPPSRWKEMKSWIKHTIREDASEAIGSGGNINKVFRLLRKKEGKPVSAKRLAELMEFLDGYSIEHRIRDLNLRPDRADVIVPALDIFIRVMGWAEAKKIHVPQIGLVDGLVHFLYDNALRSGPNRAMGAAFD
ncbi:MAG: exopolyphosphatase [Candidatus Aminicenantes bacterium]|nr:exopolyphosphatase [Candidatus Aminicenantes bacterium]